MRSPLVVAVAQPPCTPCDVEANARAHAGAVRKARARVVVFPELSLTGYELAAPPLDPDDSRLAPLVAACAETGAIALAGAPVNGGEGRPYIAMLAVDGGGSSIVYRKMCLGGAEPDHFAPGGSPARLVVDGWRLGLAICKDTGVPEHVRDTAALGVDAYVAGVCETADDAHVQDARAARVIADHHVWVVVASFAGSTGGGFDATAGGSFIRRPDGSVAARAGIDPGETVCATLC